MSLKYELCLEPLHISVKYLSKITHTRQDCGLLGWIRRIRVPNLGLRGYTAQNRQDAAPCVTAV